MDWNAAEMLLHGMTEAYTRDYLRQMTFCREIFPLKMRFEAGERSEELYWQIVCTDQRLMKDIWHIEHRPDRGFFINATVKPDMNDLAKVVGKQRDNWNKLFSLLKDRLKLRVSLGFYGAMEGWVVEFNKAGKRKVILVPDKDNFKISIPEVGKACFDMNEVSDITRLYPLIHEHVKPLPSGYIFAEN